MEVAREAGVAVAEGKDMKKMIPLMLLMPLFMLTMFYIMGNSQEENFEQKRTRVLDELSLAIEDAESQGKYKCCIEPPCTMCYLGDWIWNDGTCDCDGLIKKGDWDNVCPQCIKGIEEGNCNGEKLNTTCPVILN